MNRPLPKQNSRTPSRNEGFTPQQVMILVIVAVLGLAALGLAAYILFLPTSAPSVLPTTQAAAAATPIDLTPAPGITSPALVLPAACLQQNGGIQQGKSARVIDSHTIEAQVDGVPLQISYAGIRISEDSPLNAQAAEYTTQALTEGQDILLVRDPNAQDAPGVPLPRYILVNGRFLNMELVQRGLGQTDLETPEQNCANLFQQAEQQARVEKIGLWQPKRVPTATFMPFVTLDPSRAAPCDCISRPVCSEFRTHDEAQACFNACNDYNSKLDEDRDGIACEGLP